MSTISLAEFLEPFSWQVKTPLTLKQMEHEIKLNFPGKYEVEVTDDKNKDGVEVHFHFDDPEEAVIFKLRYYY